jgi:hypothetical protein
MTLIDEATILEARLPDVSLRRDGREQWTTAEAVMSASGKQSYLGVSWLAFVEFSSPPRDCVLSA